MIIMMWAENASSEAPTVDDLAGMAAEYGHTYPDVADAGWAINNRYEKDNGIPTQILIAPGMEIVIGDSPGIDDATIESYLPE